MKKFLSRIVNPPSLPTCLVILATMTIIHTFDKVSGEQTGYEVAHGDWLAPGRNPERVGAKTEHEMELEIQRLHGELREADNRINFLQRQTESKIETIDELTISTRRLEEETLRHSDESRKLNRKLEELERKLELLESQQRERGLINENIERRVLQNMRMEVEHRKLVRDKLIQLKTLQGELNSKIDTLQNENESKESVIGRQDSQLGELGKRLEALHSSDVSKNNAILRRDSQIEKLKGSVYAIEAAAASNDALVQRQTNEIKGFDRWRAKLENAVTTKDAIIQRQNDEIKELGRGIEELKLRQGEHERGKEKDKELSWLKTTFLKNENWNTELHLAVIRKDEDSIRNIVGNGAYIDARNKQLQTPLLLAAAVEFYSVEKSVWWRIMKYLIEKGADVYARDHEERTFLHCLISTGTTLSPSHFHEMADYLISKGVANLFNLDGWTAQLNAMNVAVTAIEVETRTLSLLQRSGVSFTVVSKERGNNILSYAVTGKRSRGVLSHLISLGADWRHVNKLGRTLLHSAASNGHVDALKYFLSLGLDVNGVDSFGHTPLHAAVIWGQGDEAYQSVRVLIEAGANAKIKSNENRTPLEEAIKRNDMTGKDRVLRLLTSM